MNKSETKVKQKHLPFFGLPAISRFLKPHRRLIITLAATMAVSSGVEAILPLFQSYAITHFIGQNTLDTIGWFILLYLLMLCIEAAMDGIGLYASCVAEVNVDRDIRKACFEHVQSLSFGYFNRNSVGYIHSRVISDPDNVGRIISWGLMDAVLSISYICVILVVMLRLSVRLGLLLIAIMPFIVVITLMFQRPLTDKNRQVREDNSRITSNFNEGITGARTIKTLVIENHMLSDFQRDTKKMHHDAVSAGGLRAIYHSTIIFIASFALALVLWRGGRLTQQGLMAVGTLSVFMNYATSVTGYVQDLLGSISSLIASQANIERIDELLHTESDVKDTPEVIEKYGDCFVPKKENWEPLQGDVEFEDVTFRYPDGEVNVLEHFDLKVPRGGMVAVVGETGAGKSTLANLVCRFFEPTDGRVLIDGRDARERSQLWLHSHIGCVLQTPHLFSGTVAENLRYGCPDATDEQLREAVRRVNAEAVIDRMEDGFDSPVGEDGNRLSTGEKQLLSFARALLADPRILILDEATSSVDTLTEKKIQNAIKEVTAGRTSFVIAHRLSTVQDADVILVMKDGQIVERGTHTELLAKNGYYARLWNHQMVQAQADELLGRRLIESSEGEDTASIEM